MKKQMTVIFLALIFGILFCGAASAANENNITTTTTVAPTVMAAPVSQPVIASDPYVVQTGKSFASIQAAIDDSDTLDTYTVWINSGTYTENVVLNKDLTLMLKPGDRTGSVTVQAADNTKPVIYVTSSGSGSTIKGLNIAGGSFGVLLDQANYVTVSDNTIKDNWNGGMFASVSIGNKIFNNNINHNQAFGIAVAQSYDNNIRGNTITKNTGYGIQIDPGSNNIVSDNKITDNAWTGIVIHYYVGCDGNVITRNNIKNNGFQGTDICHQCGIYIDIGSTQITNNMISDNKGDGILLQGGVANINYNNIFRNGGYGVENNGCEVVNAERNWWGNWFSTKNPTTGLNPQAKNTGTGSLGTNNWLFFPIVWLLFLAF